MQKYGVSNLNYSEEIQAKKKITIKNRTPECIEKIIQKQKMTKLDKYGNRNYHNVEQMKLTVQEKYKVNSGFNTEFAKQRLKEVSLKRYGVDNPFKSIEIHHMANNAMIKKYGRLYSGGYISSVNSKFRELLLKNIDDIKVEMEFCIGIKRFDLKINNILIDINPTITHNSTFSFPFLTKKTKDNIPISKDYHFKRVQLAKENNFELISVFDWMDKNKVIDIIKSKLKKLPIKISGHKCKVMEISQKEANIFLEKYHIQGKAINQSVCIGLFFNNDLIQVQTFGKPRYNNDVEWEAIRLATKFNTFIVGGVSKGFNYFVNNYKPKSIISYNSLNISQGYTDNIQNFRFLGYSLSQGIWVNTKINSNPKYIRNSSLRLLGVDKLLQRKDTDFPDYDGTFENSNEGLIIREGYVIVYDCGNVSYLWESPI